MKTVEVRFPETYTNYTYFVPDLAGIVDLSEYYKHETSVRKKSDILKKLAALEKEQSEFIRFETLARHNPEAADLLRQLKEI